jgi:nucleoid-associated protein YejK
VSLVLALLNVEKVIFHEVLKLYLGKPEAIVFSEVESNLDIELKKFLKDRMIQTLATSKAFEIIFSISSKSPVQNLVGELFTKNSNFVEISKKIASHLASIQEGRNSGGLVALIIGKIEDKEKRSFVGILKLEREEGARLQQSTIKGKKTFDLQHVKDLIFTEKTQIFKVGGFFENALQDYKYDGKICDNQLSMNMGVANFFIGKFLGCELKGNPKLQTRDFFEASQAFINQKVKDSAQKAEYAIHLSSFLTNQTKQADPKMFSKNYLVKEDRQPYEDFLNSANVKTTSFVKDNQLIINHLKKIILDFENGVKILGTSETFKKDIQVKSMTDGTTEAKVRSKLVGLR